MFEPLFIILGGVLAAVVVIGVVFDVRFGRQLRTERQVRSVGPRPGSAEPAAFEVPRQAAVEALGILDTPREERFDRIVTMARQLYRTESAVFSVIDNEREWHKARSGDTIEQTTRDASFCSVTIRGSGPFIIADASVDERFRDTQPVADGVRFYAGYPVHAPTGEAIGALCVYDPSPRDLEGVDQEMLKGLAALIEAELRVKPALR